MVFLVLALVKCSCEESRENMQKDQYEGEQMCDGAQCQGQTLDRSLDAVD